MDAVVQTGLMRMMMTLMNMKVMMIMMMMLMSRRVAELHAAEIGGIAIQVLARGVTNGGGVSGGVRERTVVGEAGRKASKMTMGKRADRGRSAESTRVE